MKILYLTFCLLTDFVNLGYSRSFLPKMNYFQFPYETYFFNESLLYLFHYRHFFLEFKFETINLCNYFNWLNFFTIEYLVYFKFILVNGHPNDNIH